jgi:hypothetical protein
VGCALEAHCRKLAEERGCDRIEVHCHERRTRAHRFYFGLGYREVPKYLVRSLRRPDG